MEKIAKAFLVMCLALGISIYMEAQVINVNVTGVAELHAGNYQFGDIQWQLSYDGYEYEDIENATDTVYSFVPEGNFYYRARISYGDCPDDYSQVCHVLVSTDCFRWATKRRCISRKAIFSTKEVPQRLIGCLPRDNGNIWATTDKRSMVPQRLTAICFVGAQAVTIMVR